MIKKILFRADGNSITGLGHLYRLFSFVEAVKHHFDFVFLTRESSTGAIIPKSYKTIFIPEIIDIEEEPQWIAANFSCKDYLLIADGYQFKTSYQKKIKLFGFNLIYIDDLVQGYQYADIIINHSPNIQADQYKKEVNGKLALGTKYALLRPLFLEEAKNKKIAETITSAFVCFGGADPLNLTLKAVEALLKFENIERIHVVLGGAYNHPEIRDLSKKYPAKIEIHKNLSEEDLLQVMQNCSFAISPASTILYELCCVKMPILSGFFVENQKNIYNGLAGKNAIIKGGDFSKYDISDFEKKIHWMINDKEISLLLDNQHDLFDGKSSTRLLGLVNSLLISFRRAEKEDVLKVFNWSNDLLVRQNSFNSEPIELENHKNWFFEKIKDKNTLFLIALVNNKPAGVVRYEIHKEHSIVGIMVSKEFRGQNLASEFLIKSAENYFSQYALPVLAYIKKDNTASLNSFCKAGYKHFKDESINGIISFVYKLEKQDVQG